MGIDGEGFCGVRILFEADEMEAESGSLNQPAGQECREHEDQGNINVSQFIMEHEISEAGLEGNQ